MNIILLTAIVLTVALVHGEPCRGTSSNNAYENFVHKHILKSRFYRRSLQAWERHLESSRLCGRVQVQSFIDANEWDVSQICSGSGRRVQGAPEDNLCISGSSMQVYDVVSFKYNNGCTVTSVKPHRRKVIVACNNVANRCRPVHYEKNSYQSLNRHCV